MHKVKVMSYIEFDKTKLINLNYSLGRELLRTNRAGAYASSTIIFTNTRKYHGLLAVPQPLIDNYNHILLSTIDETLRINNFDFHLSMRMYPGGVFNPKGHKYIRDFTTEPNPKLVYRLEKTVFSKEYIFAKSENRILLRYTLEEAEEEVILKLKPFLAYRGIHSLSKANVSINNKFKEIKNGASWQMYKGYSRVYMQLSKACTYIHNPDWYYNIEYVRERERGYDYQEDLYVPGFFEVKLKKGDSVVISAGLDEKAPNTFKRKFNTEVEKRTPRNSFENCLKNAAEEFFVKINNKSEVIAGFPWFGRWGRDTFIALPGLALTNGDTQRFKEVIKTMMGDLKDGLFPNVGRGKDMAYNSVDSSLWFFWAIQQYAIITGEKDKLWSLYGSKMKSILEHFKKGTRHHIKMHDNGLIWAGEAGKALTWMDAIVNGKPVTPRIGYTVEVNALWYNAIMFALELAREANDSSFVNKWSQWPDIIRQSYEDIFWDKGRRYLADYVNGDFKDWAVRPNMIFAASLPYSPISENKQHGVVDKVQSELLTPRGLRSLAPKNINYKGKYAGDQTQRDLAYHQGTSWTWLLGAFADAYLKLHGESGEAFIEKLYRGFEEVMNIDGIGTVSEVYDGDPPFDGGGAISQAWSVAELLRINWKLKNKA